MSVIAPSATRISPSTDHSHRDNLDEQLRPAFERLGQLRNTDPKYRELRNQIVEQAMPLADRLAHRFNRRGESAEDLAQVARLALVKAVNNFSADRGTGFTRFAVPSILGELKRHFRDKGWLVRVPRRLQETRLAINKASLELAQRLGREPTAEDYAGCLDIPVKQVQAGLDCVGAYDAVSLQAPVYRDSEQQLAESLGDDDPEMAIAEERLALRPLINRLPTRERRILVMRYGQDMTQSQIAEQVELSQMHVSRLLRQSLSTLRDGLSRQPA